MTCPLKIYFPARWEYLKIAEDIFSVIANNVTSDRQKAYNIMTVLSEAYNNAYLYGNKDSLDAQIVFETCFKNNKFTASIINEGTGFDDKNISWNEYPSADVESGRGLKIIKQLCDKVEFRKISNNIFEVFVEIEIDENKIVRS
ncbi:MAG: ATP-binding protein [candidate division Zixibacteria bacterium]|nr:ATP-binding protein [candidate division Zixibacteria bacterium]